MTQEQFGLFFEIPYRTIQNWDNDNDKRNCPDYLLKLMEYKLINEGFIKDDTPLLIEKK